MAATGRSRTSSVLCPLSSPETLTQSSSKIIRVSLQHQTLFEEAKPNKCGNTTKNSGLNMRKTALLNSLARITSVEADRFKKYVTASMVKPSPLHIPRRFDFTGHDLAASTDCVKIKI
ncbi:hypothetical protein F2Q68_00000703 [Brassica cretica]|uniref:Uncharacterized protein n=1 Tax=Brassica cretica TaxID=69181 RepID=A0A3N6RK07_BRACR|nr:hypothetical protein F2Q68_00000703 [Brassica cretica]